MEEDNKIEVSLDPWNGDFVIERPGKDNLRIERWVWAVITKQVEEGAIPLYETKKVIPTY